MPDVEWGIPGATVIPAPEGVEAFCATSILRLLEQAAAEVPDRVALVGLAGRLTHGELLRLARNAAAAIAARTKPGDGVACLLLRSPECMATLLGCAISGRVCLVLDPAEPPERLRLLLENAAPALLLREAALARPAPGIDLPDLTVAEALSTPDRDWVAPEADPDAPLAVHFTSGSTGLPKGIVLSARSVLRRAVDEMEIREAGPEDAIFYPLVLPASSGFAQLLGMLSRRGRLLLADLMRESPGRLVAFLEREGVTILSGASPLLRTLMAFPGATAALRQVRRVVLGAMAMTRADFAALRDGLPAGCRIVHALASTEALCLAHWVVAEDGLGPEQTLPAGHASATHEMILLDEHDRPAPPGEPGELAVRSQFVALGVWRGNRVMEGRMTPVPGEPGSRMFRTGDLVAVQPDGMLRVLGRIDRQIKINGVRIQPGEIEAVLRSVAGVTGAAVVAVPVDGQPVLHGFVAADAAAVAAVIPAVRAAMRAKLPPALRPTHLTVLERLPSLPGGKIDALALMERARGAVGGQPIGEAGT